MSLPSLMRAASGVCRPPSITLLGPHSLRWWRKPRSLPVAKSKMFKIPVKKVLPEDESVEMMRLFNIYRTRMKAVRRHLINENQRRAATSELALQQAAEEEEEHRLLLEYNHQENLRMAALREERLQKELEADIAEAKLMKEKSKEEALLAEEEALRIIRETQELVKTFIKREDLEEAIERALANPIDYNFAIDEDGHIFRGRSTRPEDIEKKDWEKLAASSQ